MRSLTRSLMVLAVLCALANLPGGAATAEEVPGKTPRAAAAGGEETTPRPRVLDEQQIRELRERLSRGRQGRPGTGTGAAGAQLDPARASLDAIKAILDRGEESFKAESYPAAFECFADVAACRGVPGAAVHVDKARARLLEMERIAEDKLEEARLARRQGKGAEALAVLEVLLKKYPYTKSAEGARDLLGILSSDPKVAAEVALLQAEELDKAAKYPEAAAAYAAIMRLYPDSVQALKAKLRLKAMNEDEAIAKAIADAQKNAADTECPRLLIMARNFATNKLYDQARGLYEKLIQKYPESDYAKEARKALEELKAGEAAKPAGEAQDAKDPKASPAG